ncbi:MAG: hypothetical protein H6Q60_1222 [Oscillospiraceae bacterium]|nr:hypothetical protein [Oscillospiraceae bacterium]
MGNRNGTARRAALVGVMTALSLILLWLSAILPTGRWGLIAAAGLLPAAVIISSGLSGGFFCWLATGLLAFVLLPDKMNMLLYLLFFGVYPMIKFLLERMRKLPLELLCKLIFFNLVLTLFWFVFRELFLPALPQMLQLAWAAYVAGNAAFLVYDYGFTKLIGFYMARFAPHLRKR